MRPKPLKTGYFYLFQDKNSKHNHFLVLKHARKEYQRNKFTFSVKADEECLFSGQKQTNMELHRSALLSVLH